MYWKDLLYFSRSEKQAIGVLLVLVILASLLLIFKKEPESPTVEEQVLLRESVASLHQKDTLLPETRRKYVSTKPTKSHPKTSIKHTPPKHVKQNIKPRKIYHSQEKFSKGTIVELNQADTATLKKIPGIASTYANRIVKFRKLLGGFYSIEQLKEVYGMTDERYQALQHWFSVDSLQIVPLAVNWVDFKILNRHPYISYEQTKVLMQLRRQHKNRLEWVNIQLLEEFSVEDLVRVKPYLSFD
jgi:DNA uptake protein ComE-like DNA-binding protein